MRPSAVTLLTVAALVALAMPVVAQDEEYERHGGLTPVEGHTTDDGVIVLNDEDWCAYLFGSLYGPTESIVNTFFLDDVKPKNMRREIRKWARVPATDDLLHSRCVEVLNQFRLPQRAVGLMPAWSLDHPVILAALAPLLTGEVPPPSSATPDAPVASGNSVVVKGKGGISGSKPFDLDGGDYEVAVDKKGDCPVAGWYVRRTEDDRLVESFEQSGYVYAVDGGRHFIKVIATDRCRWTITITPLG